MDWVDALDTFDLDNDRAWTIRSMR